MKKICFFLVFLLLFSFEAIFCQNVGIGINTPQRKLHIHSDNSVFGGLMLTSNASGVTLNDGMHVGIQFLENNIGNKFGFLYVREDIPLNIGTNGRDNDIRIASNGNVGFGINTPEFKIDAAGSMRLNGSGKRIIFRNNAGTEDMGSIGHLTDNIISIADNSPLQSSKFYFDVENEKMGIGSIPGDADGKIVITYNSGTGNPHLTVKESLLGDYARLEFANSGAERVWHIAGQNVAGSGSTNRENDLLNIWNSSRGNIMSFLGDGRVGILTTTPATGYALSVDGKIMCEELRVQLSGSWPDYVFADNYNLRSLSQLETFILQNKHLPGIPSARKLEKNGLDVGDMQKRMMEKIEELTLYIIQQQKEIDALKSVKNN